MKLHETKRIVESELNRANCIAHLATWICC